jgi:hypothetical protein
LFSHYFQKSKSNIDLLRLHTRVKLLKTAYENSAYQRRKSKLQIDTEHFLKEIGKTLESCTPYDICLYLAWKDDQGKTIVHNITCPNITDRKPSCGCPKRLAFGTINSKISQLKSIFQKQLGLSKPWNIFEKSGNPADSQEVAEYLKQIKVEQSIAHSCPKQAVPMFIMTLSLISMYIERQLEDPNLKPSLRFVLARDQALFKVMFFSGDRAHDTGVMLTQEIKSLPDESGFLIKHTWGKTFRLNKTNVFSLFRCKDEMVCPVVGITQYMENAKSLSIDLSCGYLFRPITNSGKVENNPLSYEAIYDRLKHYLSILGIDKGETPHSIRAGCAISLRSHSNADQSETGNENIMSHIGWSSEDSMKHYTRSQQLDQAMKLSKSLSSQAQKKTSDFVEISTLKKAFPSAK